MTLARWVIAAAISLGAIILYSGALGQGFVADDFIFLHQLHFKQPGLTENLVYFSRDWGMGAEFYRPLTRLYWAFLYVSGNDNAWLWHLSGVLIYAATCGLLFVLVLRISGSVFAALPAAAIFASHPAHAETVSWLANSSDLLALFFCLLALLTYVSARGKGSADTAGSGRRLDLFRIAPYFLSALYFFAGLLCKESAAGFALVPAVYDITFGTWKSGIRGGDTGQTTGARSFFRGAGGWVARQIPFFLALALYGWLRLNALGGIGGYAQAPGGSTSPGTLIETYTRWLLLPLVLDRALAWLLFAIVALILIGGLIYSERSAATLDSLGADTHESTVEGVHYPLLRTGIFGLCWTVLFLIPTATTPPSVRFVYISTAGLAMVWGVLLAPGYLLVRNVQDASRGAKRPVQTFFQRAGWVKVALILTLVALCVFATVPGVAAWTRAGQSSRDILAQIKAGRSEPAPYTPVYAKGLPQANEDALIFRTGFPEAVQLLYDDKTVEGIPVDDFPVAEKRLNEAYFVEYQGGRIVARNDLVARLQERNSQVKAKAEKPLILWDTTPQGVSFAGWQALTGNGTAKSQPGGFDVQLSEGGYVGTGRLSLPAPALSWTELTLHATPLSPKQTAAQLVVHWLVDSPGGPVERASAPLAIALDGQIHSYRVKPADMSVFFLSDIVSEIRIELPAGIADLTIEKARLFSLPWK